LQRLQARFNAYPHLAELVGPPVRLLDDLEFVASGSNPLPTPGAGPGNAVRMLESAAFDLCEVPVVSYLVAKERGAPVTAMPIFITRNLDHEKLIVNGDRIRSPLDFTGKRVGLRYHGFTDGVWARAVLSETYGVDLDSITWVTDFAEMVEGAHLPSNVEQRVGEDLRELLVAGDVDAYICSRPGDYPHVTPIRPLFTDVAAEEDRWFRDTGVFPLHHALVVNDETVTRRPEVVRAVFDVFTAALDNALATRDREPLDGEAAQLAHFSGFPTGRTRTFLGANPLAYGFSRNRAAIQMLISVARRLGILREDAKPERYFLDLDHPGPDATGPGGQ
jgi:4,5-dihydroxyphthalate decarboxylase